MNSLISIIIQYKYAVLFPIAAFEGPIVSLVIGYLIYLGYLSFLPSFAILILGDLIPDTIYYYIGRLGNKKDFIKKYSSNLRFIADNFTIIEKLWRDHPQKTMFLSKLAYGLSTPFLISAGLVNMTYKKFCSCAIPVTILQYAVIMMIGYYLGHSYELASKYIQYTGILIAIILVVFVTIYISLSKYARKKIIDMEKDEQ